MTTTTADRPTRSLASSVNPIRRVLRRVRDTLNSPRAPRRVLIGLVVASALGFVFAPATTISAWAPGLLCVFMVSLTVGVHEFCHLVVAAQGGIRVKAFYIGFGPVLIMRTWRGIDWGMRAYPVGGYVSLHGEERDELL